MKLRSFDGGRLERVLVSQKHRGAEVDVSVRADVLCGSKYEVYVNLDGQRVRATAGEAVVHIEHPRLWWVRGYGEQPLYPLETELWVGGACVDRKTMRIGLRTLTVSTEKDADGKGSEFCFVINGVKIFSMGANFVPMDSLLTRITPDRLENLVNQAVAANFNTLRILGRRLIIRRTAFMISATKRAFWSGRILWWPVQTSGSQRTWSRNLPVRLWITCRDSSTMPPWACSAATTKWRA